MSGKSDILTTVLEDTVRGEREGVERGSSRQITLMEVETSWRSGPADRIASLCVLKNYKFYTSKKIELNIKK